MNAGADAESEKVAEQRRLYGEPVGDLVRRVIAGLGVTQAKVAGVIGLSPAMLSQLMSGHRVKIGNPQAVSRLQALLALTDEAPRLTSDAVSLRLEEIRDSRSSLTTSQLAAAPPADTADVVRRLLRAVASGRELDAAAQALEPVAPGLADLVRIYGTGTREDAARHLATVAHLI